MTITLDVTRPVLPQKQSTIFCLPKDVLMIVFREAVYDSGMSTSLETHQAISLSCRWHFQILKESGISDPIYDFLVKKYLYPKNLSNESFPFILYQTLWNVNVGFNRQSILRRNPEVYNPFLEWVRDLDSGKKEEVKSLEVRFLLGNKEKALEIIRAFPEVSILSIDDEKAGVSQNQWQLDDETLTEIATICTSLKRLIVESRWCSMEQLGSIFSPDRTAIVLNPPMTF